MLIIILSILLIIALAYFLYMRNKSIFHVKIRYSYIFTFASSIILIHLVRSNGDMRVIEVFAAAFILITIFLTIFIAEGISEEGIYINRYIDGVIVNIPYSQIDKIEIIKNSRSKCLELHINSKNNVYYQTYPLMSSDAIIEFLKDKVEIQVYD